MEQQRLQNYQNILRVLCLQTTFSNDNKISLQAKLYYTSRDISQSKKMESNKNKNESPSSQTEKEEKENIINYCINLPISSDDDTGNGENKLGEKGDREDSSKKKEQRNEQKEKEKESLKIQFLKTSGSNKKKKEGQQKLDQFTSVFDNRKLAVDRNFQNYRSSSHPLGNFSSNLCSQYPLKHTQSDSIFTLNNSAKDLNSNKQQLLVTKQVSVLQSENPFLRALTNNKNNLIQSLISKKQPRQKFKGKFRQLRIQQNLQSNLTNDKITTNQILQRLNKCQKQSKQSQQNLQNLKQEYRIYKKERINEYNGLMKQCERLKISINQIKQRDNHESNKFPNATIFSSLATNKNNLNSNQNDQNINQIKQSINKLHQNIENKNMKICEMMEQQQKLIISQTGFINTFSNLMNLKLENISSQIANISKQLKQKSFSQFTPNFNENIYPNMAKTLINNQNFSNPPQYSPFENNRLNNNLQNSGWSSSSYIENPLSPMPFPNIINKNTQNFGKLQNQPSSSHASYKSNQILKEIINGYQVSYNVEKNFQKVNLCIENQFGKVEILSRLKRFTNMERMCSQIHITKDCCTVNDKSLEQYDIRLTSYNFMDYHNKSVLGKAEIKEKVERIAIRDQMNIQIEESTGNLIILMKSNNHNQKR